MRAVWLVFAAKLRRHWRSWLLLSMLITVASGFVLAAAAVLVAEGLLTQCGSAEAAALAAFRGGAGDAPARPPTRPPAQGRVRRLGRMEVSRR